MRGVVPFDFAEAGALLIDWAPLHAKGKLNALVIIATGVLSTDSMMTRINRELKHCPGCKDPHHQRIGDRLVDAHHPQCASGIAQRSIGSTTD
jgi:ribose transport system substrate-binding protein